MRHDPEQKIRVSEQYADAERSNPGRVDLGEAEGALEDQKSGKRSKHEEDVERNAIAPARRSDQHDDREEDDAALREPL